MREKWSKKSLRKKFRCAARTALSFILLLGMAANFALAENMIGESFSADTAISSEAADSYASAATAGENETPQEEAAGGDAALIAPTAESDAEEQDSGGSLSVLSVAYDPQPETQEDIQAAIDAYNTEYQAALASGGFYAALAVPKPHWEFEVAAGIMPSGCRCEPVTDDEAFGAPYYTFFMGVVATSTSTTVTDSAGLTAAVSDPSIDTIIIDADEITLGSTLNIDRNLLFEAAAGKGGVINVSNGSYFRHITVNASSDITVAFAGVTLDGGNTAAVNSVTTSVGGIEANLSGYTLTLDGAVIQNCSIVTASAVSVRGGGVCVNGDLVLNNCTISNNTAKRNATGNAAYCVYGGGIYVSGSAVMNGSTISGNTAYYSFFSFSSSGSRYGYGGGVYAGGGITAEACTVSGNAVYSYYSYGGGLYAGGDVSVTDGQISDNHALYLTTSTSTDYNCYGGGIYAAGSGAAVTASGSADIHGNTAYSGGGLYAADGVSAVTAGGSAVFRNNTAASSGGGIYAGGATDAAGTAITIEGSADIYGNTALYGGGVHAGQPNYSDPYYATVYVSDNAKIRNNTATYGGGGISSYYRVIVSGGAIYENATNGYGGGIFCQTGGDISGGKVELSGGAVYKNTSYYGGGVCSYYETIISDCEIYGNTAYSGGGIYCYVTITVDDGAVIGGADENPNTADYGGGIYADSSVVMQGGEISYNEAGSSGGGICYRGSSSDAAIDILGGCIQYNTAGENGGGIYSSAVVTLDGGDISFNAAVYGGGICGEPYQWFEVPGGGGSAYLVYVKSGNVSYNTAVSGGGIYAVTSENPEQPSDPGETMGAVSVSGGAIHHNTATPGTDEGSGEAYGGDGGGFYTIGNAAVSGGQIYENTAGVNGGGFYIDIDKVDQTSFLADTELDISGSAAIYGNQAENGGGIYSAESSIGENWVYNEDTGNDELVLLCYAITISISGNATIIGNTAASNGGGVCGNGDIIMTGGTVSGNHAENGGGIYGPRRYIDVFQILGWEKYLDEYLDEYWAAFYGFIYHDNVASMNISGGATVTDNTADVSGGGIYSSSDTMVSGSIVSGNTALYGGGLYAAAGGEFAGYALDLSDWTYNPTTFSCAGSAIAISGSTVANNTVTVKGGGFYLAGDATLDITGSTAITGNHAGNEGGGIYTENYITYNTPAATDYQNITTDNTTTFSGNTAAVACDPPASAALIWSNFGFVSVSIQASTGAADNHPVNNYDINYIRASGHTVTYSPNGGTGSPFAVFHSISGTIHTVLDNGASFPVFTLGERTFTGWNTAADGSDVSYVGGDSFSVNGDVTLYAQWGTAANTILRVSVDISSFYVNSGGTDKDIVQSGTSTITNNSAYPVEITFKGLTESGGSDISQTSGRTVSLVADASTSGNTNPLHLDMKNISGLTDGSVTELLNIDPDFAYAVGLGKLGVGGSFTFNIGGLYKGDYYSENVQASVDFNFHFNLVS